MKIQFFGQNCFQLTGKNASFAFDPSDTFGEKGLTFVTNSGQFEAGTEKADAQKTFSLPGEFEIGGVLVRGFYSDPDNVVYKAVIDDMSFVHFGSLGGKPDAKLFEQLGENVDVIFVNVNERLDAKTAKTLIETLDPRMSFIGGDQGQFPKMVEAGAKVAEENPMTISRTQLNEEKTDIFVLSV